MSSSKRTKLKVMIAGLAMVASLQTIGYLSGVNALMGLGFVTNASPLPLVFSHFRGTEPFSALYTIHWETLTGERSSARITPEAYKQLEGPYNLRNVYGAAFAAGPSFQEDPVEQNLWITMMRRAFCQPAMLNESLGIPQDLRSIEVHVEGRATGMKNTWSKAVSCD